jgi:hypothetical protein
MLQRVSRYGSNNALMFWNRYTEISNRTKKSTDLDKGTRMSQGSNRYTTWKKSAFETYIRLKHRGMEYRKTIPTNKDTRVQHNGIHHTPWPAAALLPGNNKLDTVEFGGRSPV